MADISKNKNLANDYHVFTHDSEFLRQLGLGSFTTGTLYEFWHTYDEKGKYSFRKLFLNAQGERNSNWFGGGDWQDREDPFPMFHIRNPADGADGDLVDAENDSYYKYGSMEAWRFEGTNRGSYVLYDNIGEWEWNDPRDEIEWGTFNSENLDLLGLNALSYSRESVPRRDDKPIPQNLLFNPDIDPDSIEGPGITLDALMWIPYWNNRVRHLEAHEPDLTEWDDNDLAIREFVDDVKTSRSGCISFPVALIADVKPGADEPCPIRENFTIKLHLRDSIEDATKQSAVLAMPALTKVGIRKDATGRPYGDKANGDLTSPNESDPSAHVAAEIDLHYNEYTRTYQSGSRTILAKITKLVGPADDESTPESLEESDINETLDSLDDNYLQMGTGEAMPISMQNGNPFQWTPNYATPADCRFDDKTKQKVIVYNADPEKSFSVGKTVLLHEIDGKWFPVEFGSGESTEFVPEPVFKGRWDFQNFLTNAGNFFNWPQLIAAQTPIHSKWPYGNLVGTISPTKAEKIFHRRYYETDPLNNGSDDDPAKYAGNSTANKALLADLKSFTRDPSCVRQVTGFDYLEDAIGGTRGAKRSIDKTVYGEFADGTPIFDVASPNNTQYFGVVFPDGYTETNVGLASQQGPDFYSQATRNFNVMPSRQGDPWDIWQKAIIISEGTSAFPLNEVNDANRTAYIDANQWPDDYENVLAQGKKKGLFAEFVSTSQSTFSHLPADYALNASPSGSYGRPIMDMGWLMALDNKFGEVLADEIRQGFGYGKKPLIQKVNTKFAEPEQFKGRFSWAFKKPGAAHGWPLFDPQDDPNSPVNGYRADLTQSAFDFRPIRANHIQFRPACMELFSNHQWEEGKLIPNTPLLSTPLGNIVGDRREIIINYLSGKMDDAITALSFASILREKQYYSDADNNSTHNQVFSDGASSWATAGHPQTSLTYIYRDLLPISQYGQLIHDCDYSPAGKAVYHPSERVAPHNKFNNQTFPWRSPATKGGQLGVGVVGAICTVGAVQQIGFTTQNRIGQISWFHSNTWYPSWGGNSFNRYDRFGTTDLSVRIYQAHERENLIYDSRFFAVYHFNHGTALTPWGPILAPTKYVDTDGDKLPDCNCFVSESPLDIRIPSYVSFKDDCTVAADMAEDPPVGSNRRPNTAEHTTNWGLNDSDIIYKDCVHKKAQAIANDGGAGWHRLIPSDNWNFDRKRRGRVLPFNYYAPVMQVPYFNFGNILGIFLVGGKVWAASEKMDNYDQISGALQKVPALEIKDANDKYVENSQPITNVDLVLTNLGKDYRVGDKFTITGFEGSEVEVRSVGKEGCVTGLWFNVDPSKRVTLEKLGRSVDINRLMTANPKFEDPLGCVDFDIKDRKVDYDQGQPDIAYITKSTSGGAKLKPLNKFSVSGKGFSAYVTKAVLRQRLLTDEKPKIATYDDFYQLSMQADNRPGGKAGKSILDLFGAGDSSNKFIDMTEGQRIIEARINELHASPSGLYDCFFHFHNDISHTTLNNQNLASAHNSYDQYIDLQINPA